MPNEKSQKPIKRPLFKPGVPTTRSKMFELFFPLMLPLIAVFVVTIITLRSCLAP